MERRRKSKQHMMYADKKKCPPFSPSLLESEQNLNRTASWYRLYKSRDRTRKEKFLFIFLNKLINH